MIWTGEESRKAINDFENRFQNMYKSLTQRGEKWFEYKEGKFFKLVLLNPQNEKPFIVIADGYLLPDGLMCSPDDSDGFLLCDYEENESLFQDLAAEIDRWKTLDDD